MANEVNEKIPVFGPGKRNTGGGPMGTRGGKSEWGKGSKRGGVQKAPGKGAKPIPKDPPKKKKP
jgi:hypothetical protein